MNEDDIDNHQILFNTARELEYLSKSLFIVGNETLAKKLAMISEDVYNANIAIRREAAEALNQRLNVSQQASANIVSAALSCILLGKGNDDEDGC